MKKYYEEEEQEEKPKIIDEDGNFIWNVQSSESDVDIEKDL